MAEERIIRHAGIDRLLHWLMAAGVLTLLATGVLPQLGVKFDWVGVHWVAGSTFIAALLAHLVRVAWRRSVALMALGRQDLAQLAAAWRPARGPAPRAGKYSVAQKAMHHAVAAAGLTAAVTGVLMLLKIDTPFWRRNPYWLEAATWGRVYVLHDLAALGFVSLVVLHLYFALRPEKRCYLRSMLRGWMSATDYRAHHDPAAWKPATLSDSRPQGPAA